MRASRCARTSSLVASLFFSGWDSQSAMHAETSRAASVWRLRDLRHIVPWSRVRNHSGGQNVLLVFTVRVFLYDKHPRTLDPLVRQVL